MQREVRVKRGKILQTLLGPATRTPLTPGQRRLAAHAHMHKRRERGSAVAMRDASCDVHAISLVSILRRCITLYQEGLDNVIINPRNSAQRQPNAKWDSKPCHVDQSKC